MGSGPCAVFVYRVKQPRLESTMSAKDPLSLYTDYGRYATVNAVLGKNKDVFDLMKFVHGPEGGSRN